MKKVLLALIVGALFLSSCGDKKKASQDAVAVEKPAEMADHHDGLQSCEYQATKEQCL